MLFADIISWLALTFFKSQHKNYFPPIPNQGISLASFSKAPPFLVPLSLTSRTFISFSALFIIEIILMICYMFTVPLSR